MATILSKILIICCLVLGSLLSGCREAPLGDDQSSRPIRENILDADRLIATFGRSPDYFELRGEPLDSLAKTLEISSFHDGFDCLCYAELVFYFYKGEKLIMVLGHHMNGSLRWQESDWSGDAILTEDSLERLMFWRENILTKAMKLPVGDFIPPSLE